jgi:hypothetical protein
MTPEKIESLKKKLAAAEAMVTALAKGERDWILSIPARPGYDPDLVISAALNAAQALLDEMPKRAEIPEAILRQADGILADPEGYSKDSRAYNLAAWLRGQWPVVTADRTENREIGEPLRECFVQYLRAGGHNIYKTMEEAVEYGGNLERAPVFHMRQVIPGSPEANPQPIGGIFEEIAIKSGLLDPGREKEQAARIAAEFTPKPAADSEAKYAENGSGIAAAMRESGLKGIADRVFTPEI